MIKDYSLIKNGKVVNRIVADEAFIDTIKHEWDFITDDVTAQKGCLWDGEKFTPPVRPAVVEVETVEAKLTKLIAKVDEIDANVKAMKAGKAGA